MENQHFMLKLSRLFPSSFTSCNFRNLPDVAETSIPIPKHASLPLKNPPNHTLISLHRASTSTASCFTTTTADDLDTDAFFSLSSNSGDSFHLPLPTASNRFKITKEMESIDEIARCSSAAAESKRSRIGVELGFDHVSTQMYYDGGGLRRRRGGGKRRRMRRSSSAAVIGESYAVEKRSRDPRGDFRASMVEMIVEKGIFAAEDLERLLRCFLSLNSTSYHSMIFDVFSEICQTLFTN